MTTGNNGGALVASTMLGGDRRFSILPITTTHMAPALRPGDAVVVDPSVATYECAGLYVLEQLGRPVVYKVDSNAGKLLVMCDDHQFKPQEYSLAQFDAAVLGKVRLIVKVADPSWMERARAEEVQP
jgi:phage repressor protein C with HTH and peptisase S24 domain